MTSKLRKTTKTMDPALLIIGGVNSKGEEEKWDIGSVGFKGELFQIQWRSGFRYPKNIRDILNPLKVLETAINYLEVMRNADADGKRLAKIFLSHSVSKKRVFVLAHSMGTRLAGAFLREIKEKAGASVRLHQVFLFNGAAPIHPGSNFREWALERVPGGIHNFFNPSDPVITPLAVLCRCIPFLPFDKMPEAVATFAMSEMENDRLAPPIGNFPTSTVSYNYNTFYLQGPNHGVGDLGRFLHFDPIREQFDILCPPCLAMPSTISEIVADVVNAFLKDPFVRLEDYLRPLSEEQKMAMRDLCSAFEGSDKIIGSTFELLRALSASGDKHDKLIERMKELHLTLAPRPASTEPLLPDKPTRLLL